MENLNIAIVGMENVGKSSLFNCMLGYKRALTSSIPGTTNDLVDEILGNTNITLYDTPGFFKDYHKTPAWKEITNKHLVICVTDGSRPFTSEEDEFFKQIKRVFHERFLFVVNKCDKKIISENELLSLGLGHPIYVSALENRGIDSIFSALEQRLNVQEKNSPQDNRCKVLILGRSNVGKSSIFNLLSGTSKSAVSNREFETRDILKYDISFSGLKITLIDNPGIIEKKIDEMKSNAEKLLQAFLPESDVILLVFEPSLGISFYDRKIIGWCHSQNKPLIIVRNDRSIEEKYIEFPKFFFPMVRITSLNESNKDKLFQKIVQLYKCYTQPISSEELKDFLEHNPQISFVESIKQIGHGKFKIRFKRHLSYMQLRLVKRKLESKYYNSLPLVSIKQ